MQNCLYISCVLCLFLQFYLEPPEKVTQAMEAKGLNPDDFFVLKHGETKVVGDNANSID